jgi:hypothetical protein
VVESNDSTRSRKLVESVVESFDSTKFPKLPRAAVYRWKSVESTKFYCRVPCGICFNWVDAKLPSFILCCLPFALTYVRVVILAGPT